ncbi:hypothetical protein EDC04DRAFT_2685234 [Pisolithus marmoratus]|nr:hypothetical protein EDC04DRAFT_2685234 [Pisolithus marmoratus]
MAQILTEHGYNVKGLKAQCKNFKCPPNTTNCCFHCLLFSQPDFTDVESCLDTICHGQGFQVLFLPKFHCELNFIKQCWGYAKQLPKKKAAWATRKYHGHHVLPVSIMNELKDAQVL